MWRTPSRTKVEASQNARHDTDAHRAFDARRARTEGHVMIEIEYHKMRSAQLLRTAEEERLARSVARARRAARPADRVGHDGAGAESDTGRGRISTASRAPREPRKPQRTGAGRRRAVRGSAVVRPAPHLARSAVRPSHRICGKPVTRHPDLVRCSGPWRPGPSVPCSSAAPTSWTR
ncbi:hypothetical protein ACQ4WX_33190 [Streptomyces lasalocidi]